jgi:radical SAM protein with 4Fe4S-binding SPASM domain
VAVMINDLISRAVVPSRLALICRGGQTVGYNPDRNIWHRLDDDVAEVLRWLRAGRESKGLGAHLVRRFSIEDGNRRLEEILQWAILHRLLFLDFEPRPPSPHAHQAALASVYWICTQACNLRCTYCYQEATVARKQELSTAEGLDLVDQTAEVGASTLVFTGGEPFSRRDLLEIARYSKSTGLQTNVITNGHYITQRRIDDVAETFDRVTVSLDSGVAKHHDRMRGQGSWEKAARAIDLLLKAGVDVDVNSVLTRSGMHDVGELLAFIRDRKIGAHRIVAQSPMGRGGDHRTDELRPGELLDLDDRLYELGQELGGKSNMKESFAEAARTTKGSVRDHCGAGLSEVSVDPEGWVYPCKLLQYDQDRTGNVREKRLSEILTSHPVLQRIRQPFTGSLQPCSTCIIKNHCGGGCRGIHASFTGSWEIAEPLLCAQLRRTFELRAFASTGSVPPRQAARFIRLDGSPAPLSDSAPSRTFIPLEQVRRP